MAWVSPDNEDDPLPDPPGWKQATREELEARVITRAKEIGEYDGRLERLDARLRRSFKNWKAICHPSRVPDAQGTIMEHEWDYVLSLLPAPPAKKDER